MGFSGVVCGEFFALLPLVEAMLCCPDLSPFFLTKNRVVSLIYPIL